VKIDKQQIVELLRERGDNDKAQQAEQELPQEVDTEEHSDVLQRFGVDPQEALRKMF
jgi:hypothetical protein